METAIVHLETVARVETRDHTDQPVTQVDTMMMVVGVVVEVVPVHIGPTLAPEAILFESPCRAHPET